MDFLGGFHVLAIVHSAAVNAGVPVSFQIMIFSRYMHRRGIPGSYGGSILVFWGTFILFSIVYGVRECSNFIPLHVAVQFSQHCLLKRLSFLHCVVLPPLS